MSCYHPIRAWRGMDKTEAGKRPLVFKIDHAIPGTEIGIPCGRCVGCRLDYAREWAIRCMHEAKMHRENMFLTLTYNDDNLRVKENGIATLYPRDLELFFKRFRKWLEPFKIRYYACGEYGSKSNRPHYHALIFGYRFKKLQLHSTRNGIPIYINGTLQELWPYGFSTIGDVTFESCSYTARYMLKKLKGEQEDARDEHHDRVPEFTRMSRKPGIGYSFLKTFEKDVYPVDKVMSRGHPVQPPRYYDSLIDEELLEMVKFVREQKIKERSPETLIRNEQKEQHKQITTRRLQNYEIV